LIAGVAITILLLLSANNITKQLTENGVATN